MPFVNPLRSKRLQWQSKLLERMSDVAMKHNALKTAAIKDLLDADDATARSSAGGARGETPQSCDSPFSWLQSGRLLSTSLMYLKVQAAQRAQAWRAGTTSSCPAHSLHLACPFLKRTIQLLVPHC